MPPAPGLFSTMMGCPRFFEASSASLRKCVSVEPPAGQGTTSVIGRAGKPWASAPAARPRQAAVSVVVQKRLGTHPPRKCAKLTARALLRDLDRRAFCEGADVAAHLAAFLHQHLAVADLARDAPARMDHELAARRHLALEGATHLGDVDVHLAVERAVLGDLDRAAHHRRLDPALDDQRDAVVDLDAP